MTSSDASGVRLAGDQVVLFLEIYTVKILPLKCYRIYRKIQRHEPCN